MILGDRSLANASRARQFNPLNPPGVGWVPLPQTNMAAVVGRARSVMRGRARSCTVVRGRAWSCMVVCGRSCMVVRGRAWSVVRAWSVIRGHSLSFVVVHGRAWPVVRGRAWSCVVVRGRSCAVVRAWSVIRGRAWSCAVGRARSVVRGRAVLPASRPALPCCPLRGQHCHAARFVASTAVTRTNERRKERTTYNNPLNPPGVGWGGSIFFILLR